MLETSPLTSFSASFLKKNISYVLLTDQSLLPDFEKLHKILKKIPVKFARTPLLQVASELVEYQVIVSKGVLAPTPILFKAPTLCPSLPPLFKIFVPLPSFLPYPLLTYFRQSHHPQATPSCPNTTNQPSLVETIIKRVILPVQLLLSIKNQFLIC